MSRGFSGCLRSGMDELSSAHLDLWERQDTNEVKATVSRYLPGTTLYISPTP